MPSAESEAARVVLLGPHSASDYLAAGVRFCEQAGIPFYFQEGSDFSAQLFSELKNPHLRLCNACVCMIHGKAKSEDFESWANQVINWLTEHNPSAQVIRYEIHIDGERTEASVDRNVSVPADVTRFLERDLREAGVI